MEKRDIIRDIEKVVEEGNLVDGKVLIEEYKKNFGFDSKIASVVASINFYEGKYDESLSIIHDGLKCNLFESDLYSIMGSIYESREEYNRAYLCYEQALYLCLDDENRECIIDDINNLKSNHDISVNKVSFVILTYNNLEYTKNCINSIRNNVMEGTYEIIVVDNNSTDETVNWLQEQDDIKCVFNNKNEGFPKGCNQGIEIASKENDIFLLNNDTVVMPNSIFNMRMGLYSNKNVGATGAVSNSVAYYQRVDMGDCSSEEYYKNILKNNVTYDNSYEERTKLIGFAMLIKRNVLNKVGVLDERFTPGNYEDDDISVRIIKDGYKLLLCRDAFIHHFGHVSFKQKPQSFYDLLKKNNEKFIEKWGFESGSKMLIHQVDTCFINEKDKKILEINCGMGSNLVYLKNALRKTNFYGTEENENLIPFINKLGITHIDKYKDKKYENYFNCIIVNEYSTLQDKDFISDIHKYLVKETGRIIVNLESYYTNLEYFNNSHIKYIEDEMFKNGFELKNIYRNQDGEKIYGAYMCFEFLTKEKVESKLNELIQEGKLTNANSYISRTKSYNACKDIDLIKQKYSSIIENLEEIKFTLRRMEFKEESISEHIYNIIEQNKISDEAIINIINENIIDKITILNAIAIGFFEMGKYDRVLSYLKVAYDIDKENIDTIYNLGYILNAYGEKELALKYLNECKEKDNGIKELICEIGEV